MHQPVIFRTVEYWMTGFQTSVAVDCLIVLPATLHHAVKLSAFSAFAFSAGWEEHPACKHWQMRCWCGYLSAATCRLFAYGPADATASQNPHHLLPHLNPDWFYISGTGLPRLSWKRGRWTVAVLVVASVETTARPINNNDSLIQSSATNGDNYKLMPQL